ncbi:P12 family lipoprotein (plasmid) [Borrelia puertoricensis]|uniref:P12 family lipoprotein n=1 Tax=Borrelia TaxID=138 RepID=UPI002ED67C6A
MYLTLLCFLSCDINSLNKLLDKSREKFVEENKNGKNLNPRKENQEGKEEQSDIIDNLEERVGVIPVIEVAPVSSLTPINTEVPVILDSIYPSQVKREIKEEDLVPSTKEEQEAANAIKNIKNSIGSSGFSSLIENAHNMKEKCEQMRAELQDLYVKIQDEKKYWVQVLRIIGKRGKA